MSLNASRLIEELSSEIRRLAEMANERYPEDYEYDDMDEEAEDLYLRTRAHALREVRWIIESENYSFGDARQAVGPDPGSPW
jgi:hypothetical protein